MHFSSVRRAAGCLAMLLAVATIPAGHLSAQQQAEQLPIALVNVDRLLKSYQPLQNQLAPLKQQAKELEETIQLRQAEFETVTAKLRNSQPGTPEFPRLQQEALKLQNDLRQFVQTERQALQKKEAVVLVAFQRRLNQAVSDYARKHQIQLVLRQHDFPAEDEPSLQTVLATLNRRVWYHDQRLEITEEILKALEAEPPAPVP
jgi:Skp family chaperone for outer membrane proteins